MFLATTGLTEFCDRERDLLMLGQWCLRHDRRAEWEGLSYKVLPEASSIFTLLREQGILHDTLEGGRTGGTARSFRKWKPGGRVPQFNALGPDALGERLLDVVRVVVAEAVRD